MPSRRCYFLPVSGAGGGFGYPWRPSPPFFCFRRPPCGSSVRVQFMAPAPGFRPGGRLIASRRVEGCVCVALSPPLHLSSSSVAGRCLCAFPATLFWRVRGPSRGSFLPWVPPDGGRCPGEHSTAPSWTGCSSSGSLWFPAFLPGSCILPPLPWVPPPRSCGMLIPPLATPFFEFSAHHLPSGPSRPFSWAWGCFPGSCLSSGAWALLLRPPGCLLPSRVARLSSLPSVFLAFFFICLPPAAPSFCCPPPDALLDVLAGRVRRQAWRMSLLRAAPTFPSSPFSPLRRQIPGGVVVVSLAFCLCGRFAGA